MKVAGEFFYGHKISEYGILSGRVDYGTLARAFQHMLANDLINVYPDGWEQESGFSDDDDFPEVFQWYIVDGSGAQLLEEIGEVVYYNYTLELYLWGVTHYGTAWDYVLTDIQCNVGWEACDED